MSAFIHLNKSLSRSLIVPSAGSILAVMLLFASPAHGQNQFKGTEICGFYGWQYGGSATVYQGTIDVVDAENFGGTIDIPVGQPNTYVELSYTRQNTRLTLEQWPSGLNKDLFDMSVEYYQIGGIYAHPGRGKVVPYGLFSLGAARFAPAVNYYEGIALDDEWFFALALGLGAKAYVSDKIGIRLQARMLMPITFYSGSLWFGSSGAYAGVSGGSAIIQGDVFGGVFFVFD